MLDTAKALAFLIALPVLLGFFAGDAIAAPKEAGAVEAIRGNVSARGEDGRIRKLRKDAPVFRGDTITTARRALVVLRFKDQSQFVLDANAEMSVDEFAFEEEEESLVTSVAKGAFRFLTGLIAKKKPEKVGVNLSIVATIGIRGTNVAGELVGQSASVVLLDPEDPDAPNAVEVFNEHGRVTLEEPGFGTTVPDANSPPTPPRRMRLRTIENLMRTLQTITRISVPQPRVQPRLY